MNVINIPFEHKMFQEEICGTLSNFVFDEFSILFTEKDKLALGVKVFFEADNEGDISGTQIHLVRLENEWVKGVCYEIQINDKDQNGLEVYCNSFDKKYLDIGFEISELVIRCMIYIMNTPREVIEKQKQKINKKSENKKQANNATQNKIYLLDDIVNFVNKNNLTIKSTSGCKKITCDCWGVRGHYRHYKSGKVIFIKEYKKGKERENKEPKGKRYYV